MDAILNRCDPAPMFALPFALSMRPGKVGGTETTMAAAARQFCQTFEKNRTYPRRRGLLFHRCTYTCHEAGTSKERRPGCDVQASTEGSQVRAVLIVAERAYIGDNNSNHRSNKYGVTTHKRQKSRCAVNDSQGTDIILVMVLPSEYLPWTKRPATEKGTDNLPTSNVDIAGIQRGHFIPGFQRIG